jgi:hypothetical protein
MKYPDGTLLAIGDHVWWDGGVATGRVTAICESSQEYVQVGASEPTILICYDGSHSPHGAIIGCPERLLADDGIGRLTKEEEMEVAAVIGCAGLALPPEVYAEMTCGVFADFKEGKRERWKVAYFRSQRPKIVVAVTPDLRAASIITQEDACIFPSGMLIKR